MFFNSGCNAAFEFKDPINMLQTNIPIKYIVSTFSFISLRKLNYLTHS